MSDDQQEESIINIDEEKMIASAANSEAEINKAKLTYKIAFFITLPVFMGYACCFTLQKNLSYVFGLTEGVSGTKLSVQYGVGVSFVYFFNLIFRVFGHNIIFGFLHPRDRVIASLVSVIIGMIMLSVLSLQKTIQNVVWVFISYAFVGVCEGSFGPNMLTVVNNLGDTRLYVILAMPFGVACITLFSFGLMAIGVPYQTFYFLTSVLAVISIIVYLFTIYPISKQLEIDQSQTNFDLKVFWNNLKDINIWFPKIWLRSLVFLINMICLAMFNPGCTLYVYKKRVNYHIFNFTISHEWFMFLYNAGGFIGDFVSRKVMNQKEIINPLFFFCFLLFGLALNMSLIPEIAPLAAFMFMWANGGLYAQSTKIIGQTFVDNYHLTATSIWLFIGDMGSTAGSNLIQPIRPYIDLMKSRMY